ncbi:MAG: ACT domain-containing protein [Firmicutes bacterium]|nr:ACT domain-containing protein [Bacillota bacterium]
MLRSFENKGMTFFLVQSSVLPEVFKKTVKAKELLRRGQARTVQEAAEQVGISRSAFYKYKDAVFPFSEGSKGKIITINLLLEHKTGVLSRVLSTLAQVEGNVLTINQGLPLQGVANASISFETGSMSVGLEDFIERLRGLDGVAKVELVSQA